MIDYDKELQQFYDNTLGPKLMGDELLNELRRRYYIIQAGQILCYRGYKTTNTIMFQTLCDILTEPLKKSNFIPYEPGSIVKRYAPTEVPSVIPAIIFKKIFFPDKSDISYYNKIKTI